MQKSPQPQAVWSPADFQNAVHPHPVFLGHLHAGIPDHGNLFNSPHHQPHHPADYQQNHTAAFTPPSCVRLAAKPVMGGDFLRDCHPVGPEIKCSRCQKSSAQPTSQAVIPALGNAPFVPVRLTAPRRGNTRPIPAAGRSWCASHPASSPDARPTHRRCAPPAPWRPPRIPAPGPFHPPRPRSPRR